MRRIYLNRDKAEFLRVLALYRQARDNIETDDGKRAFIVLSVQLHAASGLVPRAMRRMVRR